METRLHAQAKAPGAAFTPISGGLLRKCACGAATGSPAECSECGGKQLKVRRKLDNHANSSLAVPANVHKVLRSPGQPLDAGTRAFMEPRFGHDFSQVRVHAGEAAERSARDVEARAYTVGRDIVFGTGEYAPQTEFGRELLSHELTHVVQQAS